MKNLFFVLFFFSCFKIAAQQKPELLFDYLLKSNDYALISIEFKGDLCVTNQTEVNLIYFNDSVCRIHSVRKNFSSKMIDTVFTLNGAQIMFIDRLPRRIRENNLEYRHPKFAGSRSKIKILFGDQKFEITSMAYYSLLEELLLLK